MTVRSAYAPVDPDRPRAIGYCDRCGFQRLLCDLPFQYDWRGNALVSTGLRVCKDRCLDKPQPNGRRPVIIGPDPRPLRDPRPGFSASQMAGSGINGPVSPLLPNSAPDDNPPPTPPASHPLGQFVLGADRLGAP